MLEIRELTKVYKTKGGAEVRALDGVSVRFEEKGMVFLLGKSGSGKSTLLNLCGGLDSPDSGEIVIKGRSSKDFTQSDFDSYRNTFVGFVFQEYNILNEFSVEDNIALALELQGKNKEKERVKEILRQVEMEDYARRKPNTLSGGQKQRIAIARALVKNPEIIMADEPTGALDSNTGKQVFDTLTKLSENKLVIVVSHDREFAEIYGDRIIELKDGKIISDVTKTRIEARTDGENIMFIGDNTISVRSGAGLTDADMRKIRDFLSAADEDVIISSGKREIADFKKAARIDEGGARETFKATDEEEIPAKSYTAAESKFIRSKLPARHAFRIGANSLKVKPLRLIFTILLSFIAFTMFGLFSTLTFYDEKSVALESYLVEDYETLTLTKQYRYKDVTETNGKITYISDYRTQATKFTPEDLREYNEKYKTTAALYRFSDRTLNLTNVKVAPANSYYGEAQIAFFATTYGGSPWETLAGETDPNSLGENDIIIPSFMFDMLKKYGLTDNEKTLTEYADAAGLKLNVQTPAGQNVSFTVKGVYRNDPPAKYDKLKTDVDSDISLFYTYQQRVLNSGLYNTVLVSDKFHDAHIDRFYEESYVDDRVDYGFLYLNKSFVLRRADYSPDTGTGQDIYGNIYYANSLADGTSAKPKFYFFDGKQELGQGELAVPFNLLYDHYSELRRQKYEDMSETGDYEQAEAYLNISERYLQFLSIGYFYEERFDEGSGVVSKKVSATEQDYKDALNEIKNLEDEYGGWDKTLELRFENPDQSYGDFSLAGFFYGEASSENSNGIYLSQPDFEKILADTGTENEKIIRYTQSKYVEPKDAIYGRIVIPCPERAGLKAIIDKENIADETNDALYAIDSEISASVRLVSEMIEMLENIFLWVGVVMAAFAMLLLFNFISVSITYKKREIGILRAVGARSTDVFKIFYSESSVISLICFVLAFAASFFICGVLNKLVSEGLQVAIFVFGPYSWLIMLGIALVTSFIATFLPVYSIAKRKPVESIRAL